MDEDDLNAMLKAIDNANVILDLRNQIRAVTNYSDAQIGLIWETCSHLGSMADVIAWHEHIYQMAVRGESFEYILAWLKG